MRLPDTIHHSTSYEMTLGREFDNENLDEGPTRSLPSSHSTTEDLLNAAIPDISMPEDYGDLLCGLEYDDLNDFDGLDEDRGPWRERNEQDDPATADRSIPHYTPESQAGASVGGFATAGGRAIAPPSKAALAKVSKIFEEDVERDLPSVGASESSLPYIGAARNANKRPRLDVSPETPLAAVGSDSLAHQGPELSGSELKNRTPGAGGFKLASGGIAPLPSRSSMARGMAIFGESDSENNVAAGPSCSPTSGILASGPPTSMDPSALVSTTFRPLASSAPSGAVGAFARPQSPAHFSAPRAVQSVPRTGPERPSTPSRLPLQTTTNTFAQRSENSTPHGRNAPSSIHIKTPVPLNRIGLGSTHTPRLPRDRRKGFITPFKKGGGLSMESPGQPALRASVSGSSRGLPRVEPVSISEPVFDLAHPLNRKTLRQARLHPQWNSIGELRELDIPDAVWDLNFGNAIHYHFTAENGSTLSHVDALDTLKLDGCHFATGRWVDNHWSLILWKIAGQILAKPELFVSKWSWGEIINQLKYRYEREFGAAQRPLIRRIQEHDSSPSLPLVLCVSAVHRPAQTEDEKGRALAVKPYLELTDGWYRINAEVDDCLARAIDRGKIAVGRKLAISGAKLDSDGDGAEVLDAQDRSRLIISGNSSSMARWHSKLGLQPQPFVSGLSKLSVDGGIIVLMDLIIDKIFPLAFMPAEKGDRAPPWNEAEERVREEKWKDRYASESTRLQDKMRTRLEKVEDLVNLLASHADRLSCDTSSSPPDTLDNDFDDLLAAKDIMSRLRSMSSAQIVHLAQYAQSRMIEELNEGQAGVDAELQTLCPSRAVRDFRVVRFRDAQEGKKEAMRAGMLNVWDAKALGERSLDVGKRYLVTNLMPGRNGDWSLPKPDRAKAEIYLHTRRDSRWQMVGWHRFI